MGLLDELLGSLVGAGQARSAPVRQQSAGAGMSDVLIALLPVVLGMLSNRSDASRDASQAGLGAGAGGLGDVLGQVLGGSAGSRGAGVGGLGGLLEQLQRAGFGEVARSWVSTGENAPIPPGGIEEVFGRGGLAEIARRAGVSESDASRGLSELLPEVVDRVTPNGEVPDLDSLAASVAALARRLQRA